MAVFMTGAGIAPPATVTVNITGSGSSSYCYATINGTKYISEQSGIEVSRGDEITFGIYGQSGSAPGKLIINEIEVISTISGSTEVYVWVVPSNINEIQIALETVTWGNKYGKITVTTS